MNKDLKTKFFRACAGGENDKVEKYLKEGIDPNERDEYNYTGLIYAGRENHVGVARILLDNNAELEASDDWNRTALFHAASLSRPEIIRFLVERGANINPIDTHGWTPLDLTKSGRFSEISTVLEELNGKGAREL